MTDILEKLAALTQKDEEELLACPFCGHPAERDSEDQRDEDGDVTGYAWLVACNNSQCKAKPMVMADSDTPFDVVDEWNTRPREAALIALVEEAAVEIERYHTALVEISKHQEYGGYGSGLGYTQGAKRAQAALNPQEAA